MITWQWVKEVFLYTILFIVSVILQSTVFHFLQIEGVKPDLLLIVVILVAVLKGTKFGAGLGFVYGLLEDLLVSKYIGLQALTKMLTGYIIGRLERRIFSDNVFVPIVVGFLGTLIHSVLVVLVLFLIGKFDVFTPDNFVVYTLSLIIYNVSVSILVYGPLYKFNTQGVNQQGQ